jgi:hypothetical protein
MTLKATETKWTLAAALLTCCGAVRTVKDCDLQLATLRLSGYPKGVGRRPVRP